jgi:hypothetical protein
MFIINIGFSDAGNRLKPTTGINDMAPANMANATANVTYGLAIALCSNLRYDPLINLLSPRKNKLPSARSWLLNILLDKKGIMVSDTNNDAITVVTTAAGRLRIKSPAPSGKNSRGKKANINVAVQPITASPICLVAAMAASLLL